MRKIFLIGLIVQTIIIIISLVLKDQLIIKNANSLLLGCTFLLAGGSVQGGGGWEYTGLKEDDKKKVLSHRGRTGLKFLLFIIPSLIVMSIYFMYFGFSL